MLLPRLVKRSYNAFIQTIAKCLCIKMNDGELGTGSFQLHPDNLFDQKLKGSPTLENNSNHQDNYRNGQLDIEPITGNEDVTGEVINDLLCDNINLKTKLEKVIVETKSLNKKVDEIGTHVKEISDVCDILAGEILKEERKPFVKNHL